VAGAAGAGAAHERQHRPHLVCDIFRADLQVVVQAAAHLLPKIGIFEVQVVAGAVGVHPAVAAPRSGRAIAVGHVVQAACDRNAAALRRLWGERESASASARAAAQAAARAASLTYLAHFGDHGVVACIRELCKTSASAAAAAAAAAAAPSPAAAPRSHPAQLEIVHVELQPVVAVALGPLEDGAHVVRQRVRAALFEA